MSPNRQTFPLIYRTGEPIRKGDKVMVFSEHAAVVEEVLVPGTPLAANYYVEETGGFLLRYDNGQFEVWTKVEDELTLQLANKHEPKG